jgi:hypothetical protein
LHSQQKRQIYFSDLFSMNSYIAIVWMPPNLGRASQLLLEPRSCRLAAYGLRWMAHPRRDVTANSAPLYAVLAAVLGKSEPDAFSLYRFSESTLATEAS